MPAMKHSLQLKTSLKQKLTPQMQQSLQILQLASQELADSVQAQLDENPLLEQESSTESPDQSDATDPLTEVSEADQYSVSDFTSIEANGEPVEVGNSEFEPHWESLLSSKTASTNNTHNGETSDLDGLQNISAGQSLSAHLLWQIRMTALSERDISIARMIFHNLDEQGYLTVSPSQMALEFPPADDVQEDEIEAVLSLVKTLEPLGVGARNLSERLCLLLRAEHPDHPDLERACNIAEHHIEPLARKNWADLRSKLACSAKQLERAIALLTSVSPRVTGRFGDLDKHQIVPDLLVFKSKASGQWQARINPDNQHRLKVNEEYAALLNSGLDQDSSEFIKEKLNEAKVFIKSLMSRYDTLSLVGQAIVDRQSEFFDKGEASLKAMVLSDLATALDLHESTISRATAGKYLQCPQGVFELKYFFSTAVGKPDGSGVSATAIRSLIKRIVDAEDKNKPLSDAKIMAALEAENHQLARRTVAKYRESLGILPASQRKNMAG